MLDICKEHNGKFIHWTMTVTSDEEGLLLNDMAKDEDGNITKMLPIETIGDKERSKCAVCMKKIDEDNDFLGVLLISSKKDDIDINVGFCSKECWSKFLVDEFEYLRY